MPVTIFKKREREREKKKKWSLHWSVKLKTWKRTGRWERKSSRWSPWKRWFLVTRIKNPSLKSTLCIAVIHWTKTLRFRQNSDPNPRLASPRNGERRHPTCTSRNRGVWSVTSRRVRRRRGRGGAETAPYPSCVPISIRSQSSKSPRPGRAIPVRSSCTGNELAD